MARSRQRPTYRLRMAVESLPQHTKEAMLRGIDSNRIIVGAYTDPRSGGICPMLAAHRNGGRTSVASFAFAWDEYTGAKRPRRATRREVRTLRALLEGSLGLDPASQIGSIAEAAAQIRAERERFRCATSPAAAPIEVPEALPGEAEVRVTATPNPPLPIDTGERYRGRELRLRPNWAWMRPTRRLDEYKDLLAAAEEQLAEQRAAELLEAAEPASHLSVTPR